MAASAQQLWIKGTVKDKQSKQVISYATVAIIGAPGMDNSTSTNDAGQFTLKFDPQYSKIRITSVGFEPQDVWINKSSTENLEIFLESYDTRIDEVIIKAPRIKYSNKNNPAVELIRQVIEHKDQNRLTGQAYVEYEQYEKISLGLSNLSEKFKNRKAFKNYQFLFEKDDSVKTENRYILPAYI